MKRLLQMLLLVALMVPIGVKVHAQETLTVADGTTTNNFVPVYGYYADAYLRSQVIYPANDLAEMAGGTIEQLTFYASESSVSWGSASFVVKLAEVTQTGFSGSYIETTMTTVYSGTLSIVGGQMTVTFSTPYEYNGGNLLMEVDNIATGSYVTSTWYGISANGASVSAYSYSSFSSISSPYSRNFIPKTSFMYTSGVASCYAVKGLAAIDSMTTSEGVAISWIDTNNSGANYNVYLVTATDTIPLDNTSDNFFSVDTLQPNTSYTFGVVADCGGGDLSSMRTVTVRTACAAEAFPWSEDFSASLDDNMCWRGARHLLSDTTALTLGDLNSTSWNYAESVYDGLPAGNYWLNIYGTDRSDWLVTPTIDLSEESEAALKFDVAFTKYNDTLPAEVTDIADDKFVVLVSTTNGATWDTANAVYFNLPSLASTNYVQQIVDLSRYAGEVIRIAFYGESTVSGGDNDLHIDNLQVTVPPTCLPVTNFTVVSGLTTAHTATLSWVSDAGDYQVEYKLAADTTWTTESVSDTFYVITDLDPVTTYNVRVKALCGGDESDYSATLTFTTTVACPAPTNLRAVLTPGDGTLATILWEDLAGSAWQVCLNGDTNNLVDVTDTTALDFDTLTPETTYTVMVRRNCDDEGEGYSVWTPVVTFTPTDAYSITVNDGTTTNSYVPIYGLWVDNHIHSRFVIPAADLSQMQFGIINKLTFYSSDPNKNWGAASFEVYLTETSATGVSSLSPVDDMEQVYSGSLSIVNNKMEVTFATPYQYIGGNLLVAFEQPTSGTYSSCAWYGVSATGASMGGYGTGTSVSQRNFLPKMTIDYIPGEEPSCFPVNGLAVIDSMTSAESVTLTWVDSDNSGASYNVYIIDGTDTTIAGTTSDTEYTIDELSANTTYTFGVAADCGGDEALIRIIQVRTPCVAIDSLPWIESFESYPSGSSSGSNNAFNDPCWRVHNRYSGNYPYITNSYRHSGSNAMAIYGSSSNNTVVALPAFEEDLSNLMVNLWANNASTSAYVEIGVMSNPDDASTFVPVMECRTTTTYSFENFETRFTGYTSGTIALRYNGSYNSVYVDDITVMVAPSCLPVVGVSISDTSDTEATIHILDTVETGNYHIVMLLGSDTAVNEIVTDTVVNIDTLQSSSVYTLYVSSLCDDGTETRAVSTSVHTSCADIAVLPWVEGFEGYTATTNTLADLNCWNTATGSTSNLYVVNSSGRIHSGNNSLRFSGYATTPLMAILPSFEDDINTFEMSLWVLAENGTYSGVLRVGYVTDATDTTTFVQTALLNAADYTTYTQVDVTFTNAPEGARIAIQQVNDNSNYWWWVDDINVHPVPDCPRPQEFAVVDSITTAHTATIVWMSNAGSFQVEYKKAADTSWTVETVTDTFAVLTGLDVTTAYNVRVKAICSGEESFYSNELTFTTTVSCPAPANLRAVLTPGDGTTATLVWSDPTASAWQICLNGDTNNYIDVTDSATYTFDTLTPEQPYTLKVRRDCTDEQEGYSTWSSTITFVPTDAYSLIVNDGTSTNSYVPIYGTYVDEGIHSRFIIPAADLAQIQFGIINKLVFYASNTSVTWSGASFQVYMTETDATTVSSVVSTTDMEQVYSGSLSIANNKMEIDFTTPYQYMGGNLMIAFEEPTTGSWSSCSWYGISATGASMGGYGSSVSQQNFLPKTTIYFIPGAEPTCFPVSDLQVVEAMTTDESITVTWEDTVNSAATYDVYIINGTDTLAYTSNTTSYTFQNLQPSTLYTILVAANCGSDEAIMRSVVAHTECSGACDITIVGTDAYGDGWNGGYIDIVQNGYSIAHCTVSDQGLMSTPITETYTYQVCSGSPVTFVWNSGEYDDEVSFVIKNANDSVLYTVADADALSDNAIFYTATNPCEGAPVIVPDTFYVTLNSANSAMGTVSPAGATAVADGGSFTATATAATGYHFVSWTNAAGATVSTANPYTFTVTADVTLTATFEANSTPTYYTVSVSSADTAMGTVSCTPSGSVEAGTSVTATATPANNHVFTGWVNAAGDTVSHANPYTFTVTADITLVGTFRYDGVGIETVSLDNVSLYPNPASTSVTISGLEAKATVTLVDINGHVSGQWTAKDNTLTIDLTNYATGTYFVRIVGEQAMAVRKLIVK